MRSDYHKTVLLHETIEALNVRAGEKYIDATFGGGGHTEEILRRGGTVLGLDVDQDALDYAEKDLRFKIKDLRIGTDLILARGNFKDIDEIARGLGFVDVAGIVFDLGVSSHQIDTPGRGFSFQTEGPLDMRMDQDLSVKAADLVNALSKEELAELFTKLGEEPFAKQIAGKIVEKRKKGPIRLTSELVEAVKNAVAHSKPGINPATRVFQALRIAINDEINNLRISLPKAWDLLDSSGRIAVISFHSLEDRVVKFQFRAWEERATGRVITKKPVIPNKVEIKQNNRSRSAKLRVIEKI